MTNCKNVLFCSISYRRNIKDMPFVKTLTDYEQAIGVTRSLSEIFNDEFEFKALKNISIQDCKYLQEEGAISLGLIDNKDISAYGKSFDSNVKIFANEQDHIKIIAYCKGFDLEKCYQDANAVDDKILDKLEISFSTEFGFLTSNPLLCGTGMELEALLFLPALVQSEKLNKIAKDVLKNDFEFISFDNGNNDIVCPFVKIKNKYTFGYKENEFAEKFKWVINKIIDLETIEENNLFDFSASFLVDKIYRSFGIVKNAYRLDYNEAVSCLGYILWGIKLNVLKTKKQFDILDILCKIKENHLTTQNLNIKELEKKRAKCLSSLIDLCVEKGEVDV